MSKLFQPLQIGKSKLQHRVVMAPMTRYRSDDENVLLPFVKDYYEQRACIPGTLTITEATYISARASGNLSTPGIWSPKQIAAWKEVTQAVHSRDSLIYCQLWALGRAAVPDLVEKNGGQFASSSAVPMTADAPVPKALSEEEIKQFIADFASAARNAIEAGFDGVEIHGANGYLIDQFTQDTCNKRTDSWGGSIENRAKFAIEVTKAVVAAIGGNRTGIRLSPFSPFQAMKMYDPIPQFTYLLEALKPLQLAYIHLIEPRVSGISDVASTESLDELIDTWEWSSPIILAGGFKPESARKIIDEKYKGKSVALAFARYFISNPDLVFRIREHVKVLQYDRSRFYNPRSEDGYADYPFSEEFKAMAAM